jgi:hypothetical protein
MKNEHWKRIEQLYHAALERDSGAREGFLAQACADDDELRREVELDAAIVRFIGCHRR